MVKKPENLSYNDPFQSYNYMMLTMVIMRRERGMCFICGSQYGLEIHHLIPRSHGGIDCLTNCIAVCETCHTKIHNNHPDYKKFLCTGFWKFSKLKKITKMINAKQTEQDKWTRMI